MMFRFKLVSSLLARQVVKPLLMLLMAVNNGILDIKLVSSSDFGHCISDQHSMHDPKNNVRIYEG